MLGDREKCFYDKIVTENEIPTLVGLIPIEFPRTHIVIRIVDCMISLFGLERYRAHRSISVVQGEHL